MKIHSRYFFIIKLYIIHYVYYKYEQLKGRIPYDEVDINKCPIFKKNLMHLGQLKLLMSENIVFDKNYKSDKKE